MSDYDFDGEQYEEVSDHQTEWGMDLMKELNLSGREYILDLGCGDGKLTEQLANMVTEGMVVGVDSSAGMLETARKRSGDNLHFRQQDVTELDYEAEFDVIFSNAALHWVKNHDKLLAGCYRALKKDGKIRFNFAADGNCSHLYSVVKMVMRKEPFKEEFADFVWPWYMPAVEEYETLVGKTGFSEVKVWGENRDRYFDDREQMIGWIDQPCLVPFLEVLPEEKKESFRDIVVQEMISRCEQEDGRCFETFCRVNVLAERGGSG